MRKFLQRLDPMGWLSAFWVGSRTGFTEIRSHPLRSSLSALGILFGVAVMTAMLSLMGGMNYFLKNKMGEWMGSVFIWSVEPEPSQKALFSRSPGLKFKDAAALEADSASVKQVYRSIALREHVMTRAGEQRAQFFGIDSSALAKLMTMDVEMIVQEGRPISENDFRNGAAVCLISQIMARDIGKEMRRQGVPDPNAIGTNVILKGRPFKIIGIFGPKTGEMKQRWMRRNIYAPLLAVQKYAVGYNPDPGSLWIQARDPLKMDQEIAAMTETLLARHRGVEDFEYSKPDNLKEFIEMMGNISRIMGIIAMISLLSGGLGIMNVMLSSVSERVREIGVRMALGAGRFQIFVQFVAESIVLCTLGGALGGLLGSLPVLFGEAIEKATDGVIMPQLPPGSVMLVGALIAGIGVLSGLYPALKASRMDPIEALRYE